MRSWVVTVIRSSEYEASDVFLGPGPSTRHPLSVFPSLHRVLSGPVPRLHQYYEGATTSCRSSHRASFPSLGGTSVALVAFAPRRTSAPPRPGVDNPVTPAGMLPRKRQDLPSSWETTIVRLHMFLQTPAGLLAPDHYGVAAWPLVCPQQRLPRKVFRRSIAWLSDSLSTLRRARYLTTTQDSLPAVGQTLLDGLSTRKVSLKGFKVVVTSYSPFPSFLTQGHRPALASKTNTVICSMTKRASRFFVRGIGKSV